MNRAEAKAIRKLEERAEELRQQVYNMQPGTARDALAMRREWILVELAKRKGPSCSH